MRFTRDLTIFTCRQSLKCAGGWKCPGPRFYEWRDAPESATAKRRGELALVITRSFDDSNETYGYRRVHADLVAWGVPCGPELVRSVMRELGLEALPAEAVAVQPHRG